LVALPILGLTLAEETLHPINLGSLFSATAEVQRPELMLYQSPHGPEGVPVNWNLRETAAYYVSGLPASGLSWMPGTSPGMTK
jgi:hypothetical protein